LIHSIAELCISPVGLSMITKLSIARIVGLMMGVWFLSNAFGNKLAGWAAGFFSSMPLNQLFTYTTVVLLAASIVMFAIIKPAKGLMGDAK
jgi:POT family proton-dependent oligopeptide transporter